MDTTEFAKLGGRLEFTSKGWYVNSSRILEYFHVGLGSNMGSPLVAQAN